MHFSATTLLRILNRLSLGVETPFIVVFALRMLQSQYTLMKIKSEFVRIGYGILAFSVRDQIVVIIVAILRSLYMCAPGWDQFGSCPF